MAPVEPMKRHISYISIHYRVAYFGFALSRVMGNL